MYLFIFHSCLQIHKISYTPVCLWVCVSFHSVYTDNQLQLLRHNTMTNVVNSLLHWVRWKSHRKKAPGLGGYTRMSAIALTVLWGNTQQRNRWGQKCLFRLWRGLRTIRNKDFMFLFLFFAHYLMLQKQQILENVTQLKWKLEQVWRNGKKYNPITPPPLVSAANTQRTFDARTVDCYFFTDHVGISLCFHENSFPFPAIDVRRLCKCQLYCE